MSETELGTAPAIGAIPAASEGEPSRSNDAWWPLWVAPWGGILGLAAMLVSHRLRPDLDLAAGALLVSLVAMLAGLIIYGLSINLVSPRRHPRLRRGLAVISTAVAAIGLTAYFSGFILSAMGMEATALSAGLEPKELIGLGLLMCFGWGPILLIVALLAHVTGHPDTAEAARHDTMGS